MPMTAENLQMPAVVSLSIQNKGTRTGAGYYTECVGLRRHHKSIHCRLGHRFTIVPQVKVDLNFTDRP